MLVSIHQPESYPQLGYFNKIAISDCFIFLDTVSYRKNYFQNRNRICSKNGDVWLTIPTSSGGTILEKEAAAPFHEKHKKIILNTYGMSEMPELMISIIDECWEDSKSIIADYNICFIEKISHQLGLKCNFKRASNMKANGASSNLILNICQEIGAHEYLSGTSGRDYLNEKDFSQSNIKIYYQEFRYPTYRQLGPSFNKYASIIDSICRNGLELTRQFVLEGYTIR